MTDVLVRGATAWHSIYAGAVAGSVRAAKADLTFKDIVGQTDPAGETKFIRNPAGAWMPLDFISPPILWEEEFMETGEYIFTPKVTGIHYLTMCGRGEHISGGSGTAGGGGAECIIAWAIDIPTLDPINVHLHETSLDLDGSYFDPSGPLQVIAGSATDENGAVEGVNGGAEGEGYEETQDGGPGGNGIQSAQTDHPAGSTPGVRWGGGGGGGYGHYLEGDGGRGGNSFSSGGATQASGRGGGGGSYGIGARAASNPAGWGGGGADDSVAGSPYLKIEWYAPAP